MKSHTLPFESCSECPAATHPAGSRARVLLSSVFGPYGQDDEYGSRRMNPMELYHNQVTRTQGAFSLRMFHRSWGLMMIQANIDAPCLLLDFPTLDRFIEEIRSHQYDVVGISSIIPNLYKVKKMCELIRQYLPKATIVVGGHIANVPDLGRRIDADHIVRGEGVRWFRRFLGENQDRPLRHPLITSGLGTRNVGVCPKEHRGDVAATVIPSVGCPLGCNFCSTSAMFGGKGKSVNFYQTGDELYHIMCQIEREMGVRSFFMMDENFLLHRKRALRLLELMEEHEKSWSLYVFSSANVLRSYSIEQLIRLGISWVWMGIEGCNSQYAKLTGIDTFQLVRELQSNGIRVLGSTIIGLENHTAENIDEAIDHAVRHDTDFHQFMLYTPIPGTPLHAELSAKGLMKDESEYHLSDIHGQSILNYRHPSLNDAADGRVHGSGVRSRFPPQRAEHGADRAHHAGRLAAAQEPPQPLRPRPFRLGSPRVGRLHSRRWSARRSCTSATIRVLYAKMSALLGNCTPSSAGSRGWLRPSAVAGCCGRFARKRNGWPPASAMSRRHFMSGTRRSTDRPEVPLCRSASPLAPAAKPAAALPATRKRNLTKV